MGQLGAALLFLLAATMAWSQQQVNPLKPPDRSNPRAALKTFLDSTDAVAAFFDKEYRASPSRARFNQVIELSEVPIGSLDLSALPPAARLTGSRAAVMSLYEVLSRIKLPPFDQIPDADNVAPGTAGATVRWVIPDTEISLVRVQSGPRAGEFLFSPETVARAESFYERVHDLQYSRRVPLPGLKELIINGGGWMIPSRWVEAMPTWLHTPWADQALWKWLSFVLLIAAYVLFLGIANRISQLGRDRSALLNAVAQLSLPLWTLTVTPAFAYLALTQINLIDEVGVAVGVATTVVMFLAGAWLSWRIAPVFAEALIATPGIASESIDAHLIRVTARLLSIFGSAAFLALGADHLGVPVYGIVAGLGIGGLAIALSAQPTIENLIGGLNLFADKPVRVGDVCKYGSETGRSRRSVFAPLAFAGQIEP
jgi:MscS family membrane protein